MNRELSSEVGFPGIFRIYKLEDARKLMILVLCGVIHYNYYVRKCQIPWRILLNKRQYPEKKKERRLQE